MNELDFGFSTTLVDVDFVKAKERVVALLGQEGFGILTEIDVQGTLHKKLDVEFRPYVILGACNPHLAYRALAVEPHVGLLLPCNVVLQATPRGIEVSFIDPRAMLTVVEDGHIGPIIEEAREKLKKVCIALGEGNQR